jgi:hypothetical protein
MTDNVRAFITVLGVTVIGDVTSENETELKMSSALFLAAQPNQQTQTITPSFSPVTVFSKDDPLKGSDVTLQKGNIVLEHNLNDKIKEMYSQVTGKVAVVSANAIQQLDNFKKR